MEEQNEYSTPILNTQNYETNFHQNYLLFNPIIDSLSGWMKFIGIYTIVIGAITCIGIITAAIGVPLIFAGIALTQGSKSIKTYKNYNSPFVLNEVFISFHKYFKIQGILTIISIILSIIYLVAVVFLFALSFNGYIPYY